MLCEEIEPRIVDYQDNQLSLTQREEVEAHLVICAACRAFARQLQQLDAALLAQVKVPRLSADFDRRLRERIQAEPVVLSSAEQAERKRRLQAEFEAGLARVRRGSPALSGLAKHLAWPVLAALVGLIVWCFTPQLTAHLDGLRLGAFGPGLLPCLAASAVFLMGGLAEAFPRQWKFLAPW
jgi:anti-sigma factor RsiW